ncbi:hypothetical protein OEA41_007630 [Lepraria neglecta]|uniref:Uncharacterized protein n=1 Tax=Lepraria neglecta TaxID=209136 RepID=A0AAE0DNF5_9LECA|nr:hypothetical protein OEA41_007630 [Lepraria neglecta]
MSTPSPKIRRRKDMESIRTSLPHTPSESDDEVFDIHAIVFEEIPVPSQQDPETLAKSCLRNGVEHVTMGHNGDKVVYANSGGHGILRDLEEMKRTVAMLVANDEKKTSKIDKHEKHIDELQKKTTYLESRVRNLVQSSEGYLMIRRRFLDVYKRDIKGMEELRGSKAIRDRNLIAHEGDALGDAVLFDRDQRTDRSIYRELYGLDYEKVLAFHSGSDDGGLFLVLNAYATMLAQGKTLPDDLKIAFNSFLDKVEEHWLQSPTKEPNSPLGSAYYTFWKKFNQQAQV